MGYSVDAEKLLKENIGKNGIEVLGEANGCVAGCRAGITFYRETEYNKGGVHDDQEGFYVLEGHGKALFADQEFEVYPGVTMIAPAGVRHSIKRDEDSEPVKVFWFHSAV